MCGANADGTAMVDAARSLLTAVTRVLLLADMVVVRQLLLAKDKVKINLIFELPRKQYRRQYNNLLSMFPVATAASFTRPFQPVPVPDCMCNFVLVSGNLL